MRTITQTHTGMIVSDTDLNLEYLYVGEDWHITCMLQFMDNLRNLLKKNEFIRILFQENF